MFGYNPFPQTKMVDAGMKTHLWGPEKRGDGHIFNFPYMLGTSPLLIVKFHIHIIII